MKNYPTAWQTKTIWTATTALALVVIGTISIALIILGARVIGFLQPLLLPFALAGVMAYLLEPPVRWLEKLRLSRTASVLIVFGVFLICAALLIVWLIPVVSDQATLLFKTIPTYFDNTRQFVVSQIERYQAKYADNPYVQQSLTWIQEQTPGYANKLWSFILGSFGGALGVIVFLLALVITPLYLFYFLKESATIRDHWGDYLPLQNSRFKDEIISSVTEINGYLIAFFRGQLLVSLVDGICIGIGLMTLGLNFGLLIGLFVCFMGLIPYLGILLCWIPAVTIAIFQFHDWQGPVWVTGIFIVVNQLEGWFFAPTIVGNSVGLHPLTVIASVVGWSLLLGGLLGAILAIPLTATLKVLLSRYVWQRSRRHAPTEDAPVIEKLIISPAEAASAQPKPPLAP